jgi:hypothetical protein
MNCDPFKEEEWIPLKSSYQDESLIDQQGKDADFTEPTVQTVIISNQLKRSSVSSLKSLAEIRNHHEANHSMKQELVNRPLSRFPRIFVGYLLREVWNYDYSVRLGEYSTARIHKSFTFC